MVRGLQSDLRSYSALARAVLVPQPGIEPETPPWRGRFSTSGLRGKSLYGYFKSVFSLRASFAPQGIFGSVLMQEMQETQVQCLGREDPLEKEVGTHCSILAWEIPWTEKPNGLQSMGMQSVRNDRAGTQRCCQLSP